MRASLTLNCKHAILTLKSMIVDFATTTKSNTIYALYLHVYIYKLLHTVQSRPMIISYIIAGNKHDATVNEVGDMIFFLSFVMCY